ncbi:MAG: hypothetical protein AAF512_19935, partial [Pseudomonadota bacterium]
SLMETPVVMSIEPVFDGDNGIRARIFAGSCLGCHSSTLSGINRNGAPAGINFDTFEAAMQSGERAVARGAISMTMPPSASGLPPLTQEQAAALTAWQMAGFPQVAAAAPIEAVFDGDNGIRARIFAGSCLGCHSSTLSGTDRNFAPIGINFDTFEAAMQSGERAVARGAVSMTMPPSASGLPMLTAAQAEALTAWQTAGFPQ